MDLILERELRTLTATPQRKSIIWCARYGYRLERLGLVKRTFFTDRSYLTPFGVQYVKERTNKSR